MKFFKALFLLAATAIALPLATQPARAGDGDIILIQKSGTSPVPVQTTVTGAASAVVQTGTDKVVIASNVLPPVKIGSTGSTLTVVATGTAALTSGTVTVTNANAVTGSIILLNGIGVTNAGTLCVGAIQSGTGFGVSSTSGSDGRTFNYIILH